MAERLGNADVVVVGAGLSGLVAARELLRAGLDVLVLESADRVGGRSYAVTTTAGTRVDLGGQWIGHDHHRVAALAADLGLTQYPMRTQTLPSLVDGPRKVRIASPTGLVTLAVLAAVEIASRLGRPRASTTTLDRWVRRVPGRRARRLLEVIAATAWTVDLEQVSGAAMAYQVRAQGGLLDMLGSTNGAQESLLVEGAGTLAERLAADLGDRVRLGTRVTAIEQGADGVTVVTASGRIRAQRVVVAVAPPVAARIDHTPALPAWRTELEQATVMGTVYKALAIYETPFWRGRVGAEMLRLDGPGVAVFDSTPPDGPGHLTLLVGGSGARQLDGLDTAERRDALLGPLVAHLGPEVALPIDWHDKAWHLDEHVEGGYLALPLPDTGRRLLPMRTTPVGRVHWAATETASEHAGYLDGAIEAGERAAAEVAAAVA